MDYRLLLRLLTISLIPTVVVGLQCPSCTYLNISANISSIIRTVIDGILSLFHDVECSREINGHTPEIKEEPCAPPEGMIARCSFYNGSIDVEKLSIKIPLQIYSRGCYYSHSADVPSDGCHNRSQISEDKSFLQQIIAKVSSDLEVVLFKGEICLCSGSYSQTSGKTTSPTTGKATGRTTGQTTSQTTSQTTGKTTSQTSGQTAGQNSGSSSVFGSASLVFSVLSVFLM